jgi:hypothetical protein
MQLLQYDYHGVKQDGKKSRQDNRNANRACVITEQRQQTSDQYEEQHHDCAKQLIGW